MELVCSFKLRPDLVWCWLMLAKPHENKVHRFPTHDYYEEIEATWACLTASRTQKLLHNRTANAACRTRYEHMQPLEL